MLVVARALGTGEAGVRFTVLAQQDEELMAIGVYRAGLRFLCPHAVVAQW